MTRAISDLKLRLNPWLALVWLLDGIVLVLWVSPTWTFRVIWIAAGIVGLFGIAAFALSRQRIVVRNGVLERTAWSRRLGSSMTAVDLSQLAEVDVGPPYPLLRVLRLQDRDGNSVAVEWLIWRGWRALARSVARLALAPDNQAEMSAETQTRLLRFAK
jgi:hypothetical protein